MLTVAVALGSNLALGAKLAQPAQSSQDLIRAAARALDARHAGPITAPRLSPLYETAPLRVGAADPGGTFVNAVLIGTTNLPPDQLLARLHAIEASLGRDRRAQPHGSARTIDLDLLLLSDLVIQPPLDAPIDALRLPHPGVLVCPAPPRPAPLRPAPSEPGTTPATMQPRLFVLAPLADLAPNLLIPVIGRTASELAALARAVTPPQTVRRINP